MSYVILFLREKCLLFLEEQSQSHRRIQNPVSQASKMKSFEKIPHIRYLKGF